MTQNWIRSEKQCSNSVDFKTFFLPLMVFFLLIMKGSFRNIYFSKHRTKSYTSSYIYILFFFNCKMSQLFQVKDFKPLLKGTESCRVDGMEVCGRVEEGLEEWTGQGARAVLERDLEMLVEGRTLQQWQEALRVATANTKS